MSAVKTYGNGLTVTNGVRSSKRHGLMVKRKKKSSEFPLGYRANIQTTDERVQDNRRNIIYFPNKNTILACTHVNKSKTKTTNSWSVRRATTRVTTRYPAEYKLFRKQCAINPGYPILLNIDTITVFRWILSDN